jgi:hypothetical protein
LEWLKQFRPADQTAAAQLVDALLLLNDSDVAHALRGELRRVAQSRTGKRAKVALFAEREFAEREIFKSVKTIGRDGKPRMRAKGNKGPPAVHPTRGKARVGSEGFVAFAISQAVEAFDKIYINQPGPDRIRRHRVGLIAIVTDFVGSGDRIITMLDKFLRVPSVRSWMSNGWIKFAIVAAAGTKLGIESVTAHRSKPIIYIAHIAQTLATHPDSEAVDAWRNLFSKYGPREARGGGPLGYKEGGSLIVFSYRAPNNTPLLLHAGDQSWTPLFRSLIADDMRQAFGLKELETRVADAAAQANNRLADDLSAREGSLAIVLRAIRGRWRVGQEIEFAERTGLTVPEILDVKTAAERLKLLNTEGRLTEAGQRIVHTAAKQEKQRPDIPTNIEPYYPQTLRAPR